MCLCSAWLITRGHLPVVSDGGGASLRRAGERWDGQGRYGVGVRGGQVRGGESWGAHWKAGVVRRELWWTGECLGRHWRYGVDRGGLWFLPTATTTIWWTPVDNDALHQSSWVFVGRPGRTETILSSATPGTMWKPAFPSGELLRLSVFSFQNVSVLVNYLPWKPIILWDN